MALMATEYVTDQWTVAGFKGDERITEWAALAEPDAQFTPFASATLVSEVLMPLPGATAFDAVRLRRPNGTETPLHTGAEGSPVSLEGTEIRISVPNRCIRHQTFIAD